MYAIPPVTLTTMWHGSGGQPMQWGEHRRTRQHGHERAWDWSIVATIRLATPART
jgi:hypothetical protein